MAGPQQHTSRAQQRRNTESRILAAARHMFSESGYDRTTIRAIAAAANTDPGLVMRYFGSKEELFAQAAQISPDEPIAGTPEQVADLLLASLRTKLGTEPAASLAALRSMLTHPEAAKEVRAMMTSQQQQFATAIPGDDATLRAGLITAITLGTVVGRFLLHLDGLRDASPGQITTLLRPCFQSLAHSEPQT